MTDIATRKQTVTIDQLRGPTDFRDYFKTNYGPTIATYRFLADHPDPGRRAGPEHSTT